MSEANNYEQKIDDLAKTIEGLISAQKESHNTQITLAKHISALEKIIVENDLVSSRKELDRKIADAEFIFGRYTFK